MSAAPRMTLSGVVPRAVAAGAALAVAAGAARAEYQPQDDVRVYLDPGHPFCLWV